MSAPQRIGLVASPFGFGWALWNVEDDQGVKPSAQYLRADLHTAETARLKTERDQVVAANGLLMERLEQARDLIEFLRVYAPQEGQTRARAFLAKPEGQP